ncbi:galactoside alpha-(1,2)-fucosyltransferase 2-like [Ornithodoros turicata]|uniref:galactoside alpha-(1,2)-fucosyltransferase 2-like n=1 Tax=Ornithodoros turicata TaxID=34597 RepID=UPI00313938C0
MSWKRPDNRGLNNRNESSSAIDPRFSAGTKFITMSTPGRLGNQMSGYASTYAMAKMTNRQGIIASRMYKTLSRYFRITLPVILNKTTLECDVRQANDWMSEKHYHLSDPCVEFTGHYESWTFFHHAREDIIREFTFHYSYRLQAWRTLSELRGNRTRPTYVGVHVRRGDDIDTWVSLRDIGADNGYLQRAMGYFRGRYAEVVFVVVSNAMLWCKKNIGNSRGDVYFVGNGDKFNPGRDLALLVHCNHTIITLGMFGFWGGYLAGGEVTYLANHTLPHSNCKRDKPASKQRLPQWIPIPASIYDLRNHSASRRECHRHRYRRHRKELRTRTGALKQKMRNFSRKPMKSSTVLHVSA